jgi:nucleotidyltransferase/DNA polymerase involved in DNA repair
MQKVDDVRHVFGCGLLVQAVSCDEAFLDVTGEGDPNQIATTIRQEIFDMTKCTASAGIAGNMLLARLATRKAKPNGQFYIPPADVEKFIAGLSVEDLPGVGWMLRNKLHSHKLYKCSDLLSVSKSFLQREFGQKTGNMLWSYARGSDIRQVQPAQVSSMLTCLMHLHGSVKFIGLNIKGACAYLGAYTLACAHTLAAYTLTFLYETLQERKSIGAEVNWGVRFLCPEDVRLISFSYCSR